MTCSSTRRSTAVHLRVGGGTRAGRGLRFGGQGASPRGRRNHLRHLARDRVAGCISAWAEEPTSSARPETAPWVHLRVGGGTAARMRSLAMSMGASPRGRRNRDDVDRCAARRGCISAWAEEPSTSGSPPPGRRVHLRVGGGTRSSAGARAGHAGASPRGRRNRDDDGRDDLRPRCISAWAEEPARSEGSALAPGVHLRVGGGTYLVALVVTLLWGASPRGRRNRAHQPGLSEAAGCISAWAEEP